MYQSKRGRLPGGSNYNKVVRAARLEHRALQKNAPRRLAYVKSRYFKGKKIFIDEFWMHLKQKPPADRVRRLRLYACAIDLIMNSPFEPTTRINQNKPGEKLHRFTGLSANDEIFYVQIRESKKGRKYFMSTFPE